MWHFAREVLVEPCFLAQLPHALLASSFGPLLRPLLFALAADASQASRLLSPPLPSPFTTLPSAEVEAAFCGNLLCLIFACSGVGWGRVRVSVGEALPSLVQLLHACLPSLAAVIAPPASQAAGLASNSDSEDGMASAMEGIEAGEGRQGGGGGLREAIAAELSALRSAELTGALWHACLAHERGTLPLLASLFTGLLHPFPRSQPQPAAVAAISSLAFSSDGVPQLWEETFARRHAWAEPEGGALLTVFCLCFSQAPAPLPSPALPCSPPCLTAACSQLLVVVEDEEFFEGRPFSPSQLAPMCSELKAHALAMHWQPPPSSPPAQREALLRLLRQLYDRDARRSFMGGPERWFAEPSRQQADHQPSCIPTLPPTLP